MAAPAVAELRRRYLYTDDLSTDHSGLKASSARRQAEARYLGHEDTVTTPGWDAAYAASEPAPWDIGRPQPVFVRLADQGPLRGRLLDSGCGTGEQTLLAASRGADAMGIDVSPRAIERARAKAAERSLTARFEVADALRLDDLGLTFDTIVDSGVLHVFDDADRARYVASLASVLRDGGHCHLICFSDRQPGTF